ncbi:UDP-3-O-acyl-N-acetylglucosamine deacetylase [bacterium]|nr:UDP-3-O-acyl-N-acetylglucosamine deacetylase [bacterium]
MVQRTIAKSVSVAGKGIHSGLPVNVLLLPADPDAGIYFVNRDKNRVKADYRNVCQTRLATTIMENGVSVKTVEHFMAAVFGLGITNLIVEIDADELPILDGSSKIWIEKMNSAGILDQKVSYQEIILRNTIEFNAPERETWIKVSPSENFEIIYHFKLPTGSLQTFQYRFDFKTFQHDVAPARTFCLLSEFERMAEQGFIKGAAATTGFILMDNQPSKKILSLLKQYNITDNVAILSAESPRFSDEAARHKVLDIIGDFALTNGMIRGKLEAYGTGHADNIELVRMIMK